MKGQKEEESAKNNEKGRKERKEQVNFDSFSNKIIIVGGKKL